VEVVVVALVLERDQLRRMSSRSRSSPSASAEVHPVIALGRAEAVDARDRRDDDHVPSLEERLGRRVAHPVDLVVDERVLLDVGVRLGDVGLGLVVVVVRDEVLDAFSGKNALNSPYSWAASVLFGEMTKVGRCRRSMTDATVNVLPDPVTRGGSCGAARADPVSEPLDGARLVALGV
jgi:hypothetical protein